MRISNEKISRMLLKHPAIHRTAPHYKDLPSPGEFSCGPVVKNPPCNAGDTHIPGQGTKIPQTSERQSLYTAGRVRALRGKIPSAETKTRCSQINKQRRKIITQP